MWSYITIALTSTLILVLLSSCDKENSWTQNKTEKVVPWTIWGGHGNKKYWKNQRTKPNHFTPIHIYAAKNEWEPFQVAILSHVKLTNIKLKASYLSDKHGNTISKPSIYRQHFIDIKKTVNLKYGHIGLVPDALVPIEHPITGMSTAGKYGGLNVNLEKDDFEVFWFDLFIDRNSVSGSYSGTVTIAADNVASTVIPIKLTVFNFELAKKKKLKACFQTDEESIYRLHKKKKDRELARRYEAMLHEHYISNWSPVTGWDYSLNGLIVNINKNRVSIDWSEYDKLVKPYMSGKQYSDSVPAQCIFVPYWLPIRSEGHIVNTRPNKNNYKDIDHILLGQYFEEIERHFKEMGWIDRAFVFYFDEPFLSPWKYEAFEMISKTIRRVAPDLKIMVTDGYKGKGKGSNENIKLIEEYVDVWDPVTFQVSDPKIVKYYQNRKKQGKFDMWCQTLANANPNRGVINLFPEFDMSFHRMWGLLSWEFGFQGIEWWQTVYYNPTAKNNNPWLYPVAFSGYKNPLNGDGRLFYPGTIDAIGGEDIPISSLRMKAVREAIEDYEYLSLLELLGGIESIGFELEELHTMNKNTLKKMINPIPMGKGPWHWWEGDPDKFMRIRLKIAHEIELRVGNKKTY